MNYFQADIDDQFRQRFNTWPNATGEGANRVVSGPLCLRRTLCLRLRTAEQGHLNLRNGEHPQAFQHPLVTVNIVDVNDKSAIS
jgi:hypothetical protein